MNTSLARQADPVRAVGARFDGDRLVVLLGDGRELAIPYTKVPWLKWLVTAPPEQRAAWLLEPGGFAIYWPQLDDGFEICHLLAAENLA